MKPEDTYKVWGVIFLVGASLASIALMALLGGCVDCSRYTSDREHFRDRLNEQSHRIYLVERDMIQLKRGYTFVPVKVLITNKTERSMVQTEN